MIKSFLIGIVCGSIGMIIFLISEAIARRHNQKKNRNNRNDAKLGLGTKLMLGIMGSDLINSALDKKKKKSEERRKDLFIWQDSIKDKMRKDGF